MADGTAHVDVLEPLLQRPIFLAGRGRSGTTLLTRLFDGHPQVYEMYGETRLFTEIVPRLRESRDTAAAAEAIALRFPLPSRRPPDPPFEAVAALDLDDPALPRNLFRIGLRRWVQKRPPGEAATLLEKTPKNEQHLDAIFAAFPDARVVYLVRDPRGVYISNRRSEAHRMEPDFLARQWVKSLSGMLRRVGREGAAQVRVVRFEDLVSRPEAVLADLCRFLELDWSERLLVPTIRGRPWEGNSFQPDKRTPEGVAAAKAEEWRAEISPAERVAIERVAAFEMSLLGYRCAP